MDTRVLCQLCIVLIIVFDRTTDAAWTLTGSSEFAVTGESFTLTCNPQDSNAVAVKWKRLDIDTTATGTNRASVVANGCSIESGSDTQYQYTCEPGPVYKLTIPANLMKNSQNNIVWRCESIFGGVAAEYKVKVLVPVSSISIQTDNAVNQQVNVIYENIPKTFHCITNGCRPKAHVTVTTTGVTKGQLAESTTQNGDLITTRVSQVITANRVDSAAKTLQCSAVNIQGRQPVTSQLVTLDVYYIPSVEPIMTGYTNETVLYEGDNDLTLTCQQSGGYPLSVITWSCNGKTGTTNSSQTVASSYAQLTVNRNLNRKTCTCIVRHPDNNLAYRRTLSVTFTVYYPPSTPTVQTVGSNLPWVENTQGVLRCTTTLGYPSETTYDWLQNSQVINGQTTDTYTIPTLSNVHNGLRIQCRVSNLYTRNRPPAKVSNILVLDVQYAPIITFDTTTITVQEGDNTSRPCSAISNPTPTVKWYRGNTEQTSGTGTSATLVLRNIDRNQADTYQCKATASGKLNFESSKSVSVVVYYPPSVTVTLQNTTENDTNVVFTCNAADGFPTNYTYHGWTQYIGSTIVRSYTDFTGMLSESNRKITIPKVTFKDIGRYHCSVENGFHGRQTDALQQGSTYFDVRVSAKFDPDDETSRLEDLHKSVIINIKFYSNPPAVISNIKWINESSGSSLTNSDTISLNLLSTSIQRNVHGKTVTLTGQSAILTIASLQSFHLGRYKLQIRNGGNISSSYNFKIMHLEPPEAPNKFTVRQNKTNSVILAWVRGFNGGDPQIFIIRYTDTVTGQTRETMIDDKLQTSIYTTEIKGLTSDTTYLFWIYSSNVKGNSSFSYQPMIAKTLKESESSKYHTTSAAIGGAIESIITLIVIVAMVAIFIFYRRRTNRGKHNDNSNDDGQADNTYTDLDKEVAMSEVSQYQAIRNTDVASTVHDTDINTYEGLNDRKQESGADTYETLTNKQPNEDQMPNIYVNTAMGIRDGIKNK